MPGHGTRRGGSGHPAPVPGGRSKPGPVVMAKRLPVSEETVPDHEEWAADRTEERTASSAVAEGVSPRVVLNPVLIQLPDVVPALEIEHRTVC